VPLRTHRRTLGRLAVAGGVSAVFVLAVRPWYLNWGATRDECATPLPGDELIDDPDLVSTRAITVQAGADHVWPWLAQLGQGRGGLYSYDVLENLVGCDIHSADEIVPEWQEVAVGDPFRLHPEVALVVADVVPGRALVVRGGVPIDGEPAPFDFTWAFVLVPREDGATRLLVRESYAYREAWARLVVEPVELASFVMSQKMLRGIRDRAERDVVAVGVS
jgi:hypothetical protein